MRSAVILALVMVLVGCAVEATENSPAAPAVDQKRIEGTVLETLDASSYTYVRFGTADGEAWMGSGCRPDVSRPAIGGRSGRSPRRAA